jgi:hypothetical protein
MRSCQSTMLEQGAHMIQRVWTHENLYAWSETTLNCAPLEHVWQLSNGNGGRQSADDLPVCVVPGFQWAV